MEPPRLVGNMALLPLRTQFGGPAPKDPCEYDMNMLAQFDGTARPHSYAFCPQVDYSLSLRKLFSVIVVLIILIYYRGVITRSNITPWL